MFRGRNVCGKLFGLIAEDHLTSTFNGVLEPNLPSLKTSRLLFEWQPISLGFWENELGATKHACRSGRTRRPYLCVWQCRLLPHRFSRVCGGFVRQWPFWVFLFYFRSLHVWASVALWNEGGHFSPSSQMTSARPSPTRLSPHFASRPVLLFPALRVTFLWSRLTIKPF